MGHCQNVILSESRSNCSRFKKALQERHFLVFVVATPLSLSLRQKESLCHPREAHCVIIAPRPRRASAPLTTGSLMIPSGAATSTSTSTSNGKGVLPLRSESMAYPQPNTLSLLSKIQFCMRQHTKAVLATLAFLIFVVVLSSDFVQDNYVQNGHGGLRSL